MPNVYDKEGNLHVVDSPQQAQAMIQSGEYALPPGQKVQVQDAGGRVFDVDQSEMPNAFAQGLSLASDEAVQKVQRREQFGGLGGEVAAFGFHGLNALGLDAATEALIQSKAKLHGVDPEVIRREVLGLTEENPIASGVGTGVGLALPTFFSGGAAPAADTGLLTKGLYGAGRVLTAPGRAIGALGEAAGGLVPAAGEGAGFFGKLASRAGSLGAAGATEMGAYGGLGTIGEAALGEDHELTAEKFWAGVGQGALLGLLGGTALGTASAVGSAGKDMLLGLRGRAGDVEKLAERAFGESAEGLGGAYARASAAVSGKDEAAIKNLLQLNKEGREARRLAVFEGDAVRAESARELRANIDQIQEATRNLSPEWREAKASNVAKTIAKEPEAVAAQAEVTQNAIGTVRGKLQEMAADPVMWDQRMVKKIEVPLARAERRVAEALAEGKQAEAFVALDTLKRDMGRIDFSLEKGMPSIERDSKIEGKKLYDTLRDALTDGSWGKAGAMQRDVNAAYEKWFQTKTLFDQRFTTNTGRMGWERTYGADPAKIEAYVNGLTSPRNDLTHSIIEQHIASTKALAEELSKAGELTPAKAAELGAIKKGAESFEKTIAKAEKSLVLTNQLRSLEQTDRAGFGSLVGGAVLGGPLGAVAGAAFGALANPARVVRQLAAVERIAAKVDAKLGDGLGAFFRGESRATAAQPTKGTVAERFAKESEAVRKFATDPQVANERIANSFGGLNQVAPSVASQLAFKATRAAQTLAQALPQPSTPGGLFSQFDKPRYSEAEMARWLHMKDVITNPVDSLIDSMNKGHISPADIDLIKEHSPKLYEQVRQMGMKELIDAKDPPTYQRKIQVGLLFGVPADQTMSPQFIQMTQGAWAQTSQPAKPPAGGGSSGRRPASLTDSGATASEAVEGK